MLMKVFMGFLTAYWTFLFVAFCFGYQPTQWTIGCAILVTALSLLNIFLDEFKK